MFCDNLIYFFMRMLGHHRSVPPYGSHTHFNTIDAFLRIRILMSDSKLTIISLMFRWLVQIYFYCTFNLLTISIPIERMLNGIYAVFESFLNDSENCALSITPRAAYICFKLFVEMSTLQLRQIWKVLEKYRK